MKCPKCGSEIGFVAAKECLWFRGKETSIGFGRHKGEYQSTEFTCNSIGCGYKEEVWCKIEVIPKHNTKLSYIK